MFDRRLALPRMLDVLRQLPPSGDDAEMVDCLRLAEELKAAAAAVQVVDAVALSDHRRAESAEQGAGRTGRRDGPGPVDAAVAREIGLAVRTSPFHARRFLGWARVLTSELPATFTELAAGRTTAHRAFLVAKETVFLSRAHRAVVDAWVAPQLEGLGDRRTEAVLREQAYRLEPAAFVARAAAAAADRHVSIRPAPDCMVRLSALLPVADGVACYAALKAHADTTVGIGDAEGRGVGQVMADTLIERLTGRGGQTERAGNDVQLNVLITDRALFAGADDPAQLAGYGPIPAEMARDLAARAARAWLRRAYTDPDTGRLSDLDTHAREFTATQRRYLILRDHTCRTPWCGAPIRHADHITAYTDGGPTTLPNGQGLCAACNYTKDHPGWHTTTTPDGTITTTTPTGHRYHSRPPDPPGTQRTSPNQRAG